MPLTKVVLVSGYNLLAAGCSGPLISACATKYGKRPVFLVSALFGIVGTAIGGSRISYNYLLAARIIQGFSTSAFESIIIATVGDLYFVHQRGLRISFINFVLNSASSLASIMCGVVFADLGWLWLFNMFQIFIVFQFVAMFLFCPETTYVRDRMYETDENGQATGKELAKSDYREVAGSREIRPKKTFVQSLAVWTGVYSNDSFFKFLIGPFLTLLNPAACYAILGEYASRGSLVSLADTIPVSLRSIECLVYRSRHHYRRCFLRSTVEVWTSTDWIYWCRTFRRRHDIQYCCWLGQRPSDQAHCEA
jgi:MFS family permease